MTTVSDWDQPETVRRERSHARLTARGRRLLWFAAALVVTLATLFSGWQSAATPGAQEPRVVRVAVGETLSEIAVREMPGLPVSEGVYQIQRANHLNGTALSAGDTLTIPSPE